MRNGKDDGQGREEEGRQEAVSPLTAKNGGGRRPRFCVPLLPAFPIPHPHPLNHVAGLHLIDDIHSVHNASERRVAPVEVWLR